MTFCECSDVRATVPSRAEHAAARRAGRAATACREIPAALPVPARTDRTSRRKFGVHLVAGLRRIRAFAIGALIGTALWLPVLLTL